MNKQYGKYGNADGRWAGFGPYYAIFPVGFVRAVIETMSTRRGGRVMDPFCGRGTALQVRDHVTDLHNLVEHPLEIATNLRQRKNSID